MSEHSTTTLAVIRRAQAFAAEDGRDWFQLSSAAMQVYLTLASDILRDERAEFMVRKIGTIDER